MKGLTKIEEILLAAIWHLDAEAYGVKIRQYVTKITGRELTYGHLYSALNQLVIKKYVNKSSGAPAGQRLGRPRLYYTITPEGAAALKEAKEINEKLWSGISVFALEQKE